MYRSILRNILPSTSVLPSLKLGQYFLFRAKYFSVLTSTSVNIIHLLRGCEFNIQKYYMSSWYCTRREAICRTNVILLYWTKQPLNKWFIISFGKFLAVKTSTKAIIPVLKQYCLILLYRLPLKFLILLYRLPLKFT